ncbi:hypothetical protein BpHYR1_007108 [Brachionus plicatilis]|uniref:Uncharacterized protein n=1 Tax=Brachionus plicatilis TaxID=10195 RepID=A0A3M7SIA6_BRAPC|nr:hypothetical protein BpHYR1_007108 [Brachionus plicatilis]
MSKYSNEKSAEQKIIFNFTLSIETENRGDENFLSDIEAECMQNYASLIEKCRKIFKVFEPFYNATLELYGCKCLTISIVIPTFGCLQASLLVDPNDSLIVGVLKKVLNYWTNMYTDKYGIFTNKILKAATFIDVRTKLFGRFPDEIRKEFLKEAKNTKSLLLPVDP